uniref:Uncharacterized protein n=1 Tax=Arundo donax TaxID=35708 RepID=A0A0A9FSV9_ARUDO
MPWEKFMMPPKYPLIRQIENRVEEEEDAFPDFEETFAHHGHDDADTQVQRHEDENEDASVERTEEWLQRRAATVSTNKDEKEAKKPKKSDRIEEMMERYLDMRTKQVEAEATRLAKEKEEETARLAKGKEDEAAWLASKKPISQGNNFSINRCISVLNLMEVTKDEKSKAYGVFKNVDNREFFLSANDEDLGSALIWLRNEMA